MEPFVDFGLFEVLAASGLAWLAKRIYSTRLGASAFLVVMVLAPLALLVLGNEGWTRWIAAICLSGSLLNAAVLFPLVLRRKFPS
jgi:hypothetical protein